MISADTSRVIVYSTGAAGDSKPAWINCDDVSSDTAPSGSQRSATFPIRIATLLLSSGRVMRGTTSADVAATPPARARAIARRAFA
jgi:hypothetical protein